MRLEGSLLRFSRLALLRNAGLHFVYIRNLVKEHGNLWCMRRFQKVVVNLFFQSIQDVRQQGLRFVVVNTSLVVVGCAGL